MSRFKNSLYILVRKEIILVTQSYTRKNNFNKKPASSFQYQLRNLELIYLPFYWHLRRNFVSLSSLKTCTVRFSAITYITFQSYLIVGASAWGNSKVATNTSIFCLNVEIRYFTKCLIWQGPSGLHMPKDSSININVKDTERIQCPVKFANLPGCLCNLLAQYLLARNLSEQNWWEYLYIFTTHISYCV